MGRGLEILWYMYLHLNSLFSALVNTGLQTMSRTVIALKEIAINHGDSVFTQKKG